MIYSITDDGPPHVSVAPESTSGTNLCCDIGVDILYLSSGSSQRFVGLVRSSGEAGAELLLFANDHAPSRRSVHMLAQGLHGKVGLSFAPTAVPPFA